MAGRLHPADQHSARIRAVNAEGPGLPSDPQVLTYDPEADPDRRDVVRRSGPGAAST